MLARDLRCRRRGSPPDVSQQFGVTVTINGGKPGKMVSVQYVAFGGVSCVSSSSCYATATTFYLETFITPVVVPLTDGVPGKQQSNPSGGGAIECAGATCW